MTTYYKPRWPNRVIFGSHRDLKYRLDITKKPETVFKVHTRSGPGFELRLCRSVSPPGFAPEEDAPAAAKTWWLHHPFAEQALAELLELHFSILHARPRTIECYCYPERHDLIPEGPQLGWCLSRLHELLNALPASHRQELRRSVFIE